jgi:hypothetical protein
MAEMKRLASTGGKWLDAIDSAGAFWLEPGKLL